MPITSKQQFIKDAHRAKLPGNTPEEITRNAYALSHKSVGQSEYSNILNNIIEVIQGGLIGIILGSVISGVKEARHSPNTQQLIQHSRPLHLDQSARNHILKVFATKGITVIPAGIAAVALQYAKSKKKGGVRRFKKTRSTVKQRATGRRLYEHNSSSK